MTVDKCIYIPELLCTQATAIVDAKIYEERLETLRISCHTDKSDSIRF